MDNTTSFNRTFRRLIKQNEDAREEWDEFHQAAATQCDKGSMCPHLRMNFCRSFGGEFEQLVNSPVCSGLGSIHSCLFKIQAQPTPDSQPQIQPTPPQPPLISPHILVPQQATPINNGLDAMIVQFLSPWMTGNSLKLT